MSSRFGVLLDPRLPWAVLLDSARAVERAGFASVWIGDHFTNPFEESDWHEAWTALAALAAATTRVRLGPLVTSIVYRHPAVVAKQAITLDHISGGRFELGIGAGGAPSCHRMTGTPLWSARERQERFAEFVHLAELLMRDERVTYSGRYYSVEEALMRPAPLQWPRPPLVVAAHGPKALRLAAEFADTWSFYEPGAGLEGEAALARVREMNGHIEAHARAAGRDPATITRSLCCGFAQSSAWHSVDEALAGVAQFEGAGVDEFIFTYTPHAEPAASSSGAVTPDLLPDEETLFALARALAL
jgi:alkanesulfonate monooxygenase SsuD/methylene tetrahydromethanopterin reductase-like flavin-dependent oxidoreductase (luciferase family)